MYYVIHRWILLQVFIDELDAIAPSRKDGGEELSQRMVATLLNLMDGISRTDGLLVIAATNRPDSIEPALRRPGRLDKEIEIGNTSASPPSSFNEFYVFVLSVLLLPTIFVLIFHIDLR